MHDERISNFLEPTSLPPSSIAFAERSGDHKGGLSSKVAMKEDDASAKEIEKLLRESLNAGLESPRGATPILQLKTMPLQVQAPPKAPAPSSGEGASHDPPSLADKLAPESIRPPASAAPKAKSSRASVIALGTLAMMALGATGVAAWLGRGHDATSETSAGAAAASTSEGAVAIGVASRPADSPSAARTASSDEPRPAPPPTFIATATAATPPAEPLPHAARPTPAAPAEKAVDKTEKVEAEAEVEAKPKPAAPKPVAKKEAKTAEKAAEKTAATPPPPTAAPPSSVDALLEQQLKGALP
jgi:hypothetical protein